MKSKLVSQFILVLASAASFAQAPSKEMLDNYFSALEKNDKYMGTILLSHEGKTVYSKSIGFADVASKKKISADTRFRIGSVTKMFTAALVFKAIEEQKLSLDLSLADYFPTIPNAPKITVENLLNHRSGIHNITNDDEYQSYYTTARSQSQMVETIAKAASDFEPGTKSSYSNSNYILLTYILEKAYGRPYAALIEDKIAKPLKLSSTYYGGKIDDKKNEAASYRYTGKWEIQPETDMSIPSGAGAIVSTAKDLTIFIEALFAGKIVSPQSLARMQTLTERYGMGMFQFPYGDKRAFGHTGGIDAFTSMLTHIPEDHLTFVMLSNGANINGNDVALTVLDWYHGEPISIPSYTVVKPEDLDKYLGSYSSTDIPMIITVTKNGNTLLAQATGQDAFPLEAMGNHSFTFKPAGVVLEFNPAADQMTLSQGGRKITFKKG